MKIVRALQEEVSLVEFADTHELCMMVEEQPVQLDEKRRFHVWLYKIEGGYIGIGATEDEAIADYARKISFQNVAITRLNRGPYTVNLPRVVYEAVEKL